jgi:prenyltransferase beta subunit
VTSWQLASFGMLAVVIVGGVAWYERSRPSSRIVALVAALAALAVAGRLVLAPIPNVVATTDIALLTGYALGGAPGFAVGALAAPVSNLWLGQGPWTVWQMAGWGLCGVAGAGLARATGRRLGRIGLAAACGLAGLGFGAMADLSVMVNYGGEQSLDRYLALSARGIPFNVAHALGNVALALAAGPALVRIIGRYRDRFEFTWSRPARVAPAAARAAPLAIALVALALASFAGRTQPVAAEPGPGAGDPAALAGSSADARRWLERAQNGDGGFGASPDAASNAGMTSWAMLGLEGAGRSPLDLKRNGRSPIDWLRARAKGIRSATDLERTILALAGAGVSPYDFAGRNLVAELRAKRSSNGSFSGQVNITAFAVFALRAVNAPDGELDRSAGWLRRAQNGDGGWGFRPDAPSDADSTGAALQGLGAAGERGRATRKGVRYLNRTQLGDGGYPLARGGASNSQSTAWAVQGLVAAGTAPGSVTSSGNSPLDYLASQQAGDGHYRYSSASDQTQVWVTAQALLAVNRRAFPLGRVARVSEPGGLPPARAPGGANANGGDGERAGAAGERRGPKHAEKKGDAGAGKEDDEAAEAAREAEERALASSPAAAAAVGEAADDEPGDPLPVVAGLLGGLAAALGGGFLWYRRRLP